jgi:hypothetical protein
VPLGSALLEGELDGKPLGWALTLGSVDERPDGWTLVEGELDGRSVHRVLAEDTAGLKPSSSAKRKKN